MKVSTIRKLTWLTIAFFLAIFSVTSQPEAAAVTLSVSPTQSTAQFASTFVSGTLASAKRALGSVTDTVTTFMSGRGEQVTVTYNHGEENVHVLSPELTVSVVRLKSNF